MSAAWRSQWKARMEHVDDASTIPKRRTHIPGSFPPGARIMLVLFAVREHGSKKDVCAG